MNHLRPLRNITALAAFVLPYTLSLGAQSAKAEHDLGSSATNPEQQVAHLCKAADLDPANSAYRRDCDVSKAAQIAADRQALKTAQEASDGGQPVKARRYAKYVSSLDADLHKQAEQLLARLDSPGTPPQAANTPAQPAGPSQNTLLAQATTAYQSGNLAAARATAQGITDPSLKPAAGQIVADIDRYSGFVSAGQRHEQAKEYAAAESSYQAALGINPHVAADDLANKTRAMHQMSATVARSDTPQSGKAPNPPPGKQPATPPPPVPSLQDRVKALMDHASVLRAKNDLIGVGKLCKQALDLDSANAEAKHCLDDITAELNKDPVRLEKTLREAIVAFYASRFEDAESGLNRYVGADSAKKKGAAYFYLGATEATRAFLEEASKRASRTREAENDFKEARQEGYQPVEKYVSARVLGIWKNSGL